MSAFFLATLAFILSLVDALLTYFIITAGVGYEANPFLQDINYAPERIFIYAVSASWTPYAVYATYIYARARFPKLAKIPNTALCIMLAWRTAVVANNISVLLK